MIKTVLKHLAVEIHVRRKQEVYEVSVFAQDGDFILSRAGQDVNLAMLHAFCNVVDKQGISGEEAERIKDELRECVEWTSGSNGFEKALDTHTWVVEHKVEESQAYATVSIKRAEKPIALVTRERFQNMGEARAWADARKLTYGCTIVPKDLFR